MAAGSATQIWPVRFTTRRIVAQSKGTWQSRHRMFHELLKVWFEWVDQWGYMGVFVLMAMESSIIPVPSEIVMPPAAFWAAQGRMNMAGIVLAGTVGSYVGSAVNYWLSHWIGRPFVHRFGKYFFLTSSKLDQAEKWIGEYGFMGIFLARLLPGLRHLISIPAGLLRMNFTAFSLATALGAGIWCAVLSWFGKEILGSSPELLQSPEAMITVMKAKLHWFILGVVGLAILYFLSVRFSPKSPKARKLT